MKIIRVLVTFGWFILFLSMTLALAEECEIKNVILKPSLPSYDCSDNLVTYLTFDYPQIEVNYTLEWKLYDPSGKLLIDKKENNRQVTLGKKGSWTIVAIPKQAGWEREGKYNMSITLRGKCATGEFKKDLNTTFYIMNKCTDLEKFIVYEGDVINLKVNAEDPDKDNLSYYYSKPFSKEGIWQTDYNDAGNYTVVVAVSDGKINITRRLLIEVLDKNQPPIIQVNDKITVTEEETVKLDIKVIDFDNDNVTIKVSGWMNSTEKKTSLDDQGNHTVVITAKDKADIVNKEIIIEVLNKNQPPVIDNDDIQVKENTFFELIPKIRDNDGDNVSVTLEGWMSNFTKYISFDDAGKHEVTIIANDGKSVVRKTIQIEVENVNRPPEWRQQIQKQYLDENSILELELNAIDPDGDEIQYVIKDKDPTEKYYIKDNKFYWPISYDYLKSGEKIKKVKIAAKDNEDEAITEFEVVIKNKNRPPLIESVTPKRSFFYLDEAINFSVRAYDPDGDSLLYTFDFGLFDWHTDEKPYHIRKFTKPGKKTVKVIVSDGSLRTIKTIELEVKEPGYRKVVYPNISAKIVLEQDYKEYEIEESGKRNLKYVI